MSEQPLVLVAEDSIVVRALLRAQLTERGHAVVEAADGEEALRAAARDRPDVILLDIEMPRLDGLAVLRRLKADPATAEIPVVFVSSRTTSEDAVRGLEMGAHDYLRKPFEAAELMARVQAAVRTKRLHDELRAANEQLASMARADPLTGMPNRRWLTEDLRRHCSRAARHERPVSLLLLDVDGLGEINARHGEAAGDRVLERAARCLRERLREEDVVGRWGGDRFAVIAPEADAAAAETIARTLCRELAARPVEAGPEDIAVTACVGRATWRGDSAAELIVRAEEALTRARRSGPGRSEAA